MSLDILIEGLLFYRSAPQKKATLLKLFAVSEAEFAQALSTLKTRLESGATRVLETDTEIQLVTTPELSEFIGELRKRDLAGDIGKAGAETLAIILYREPVTRGEIDRVRGVNSAYILRTLLTRGLIIRETTARKEQCFRVAPDLLHHLGVTDKRELPRYREFMDALDAFHDTPA